MAARVALDEDLVVEAMKVGNHRTKTEAVTAALTEYIARRKQRRIVALFGTIDFDPSYDYKATRLR